MIYQPPFENYERYYPHYYSNVYEEENDEYNLEFFHAFFFNFLGLSAYLLKISDQVLSNMLQEHTYFTLVVYRGLALLGHAYILVFPI